MEDATYLNAEIVSKDSQGEKRVLRTKNLLMVCVSLGIGLLLGASLMWLLRPNPIWFADLPDSEASGDSPYLPESNTTITTASPAVNSNALPSESNKEINFVPVVNPHSAKIGWSVYSNRYAKFSFEFPSTMQISESIFIEPIEKNSEIASSMNILQGSVVVKEGENQFRVNYGIPQLWGVGGGCESEYTQHTIAGVDAKVCQGQTFMSALTVIAPDGVSQLSVFAKTSNSFQGSTVETILNSLQFK